jgi:hypothetical protein
VDKREYCNWMDRMPMIEYKSGTAHRAYDSAAVRKFADAVERAQHGARYGNYEKRTLNFLKDLQRVALGDDAERARELFTKFFTSKPELKRLVEIYAERVKGA